jgi:hypothetical protein
MSKWAKIRETKNQPPRKLTEVEIEDLVSVVSPVRSPDKVASDVATQQIKNLLRLQLKGIELCPEAISEMKSEIAKRYEIAQVTPGEAVGITVAEAIAAISTQMTLKTTHKSGSAESASAGIEPLLELLYIRKERRNPSATIFFNNRNMSLEETLNKRIGLVKVTIDDIRKNYEIIDFEDLDRNYWWYREAFNQTSSTLSGNIGYIPIIRNKPILETDKVLRLYLNVDEMYRMRITMEDVVKTFDFYDSTNITCIHGPLHTGIIDIYYNKETIDKYLTDKKLANIIPSEAPTIFYNIVVSELKNMKIKGVEGIYGIVTSEAPVWQIVSREELKEPNVYYLLLRESRAKYSGITRQSLIALLNKIGINTINSDDFGITVQTPNGSKKSPGDILKESLDKDVKKMESDKVKTSELERLANIRYIRTVGSNLQQIFNYPEVDGNLTISNNFHEITQTLGIEAAYAAMCNELDQVIRNVGSYVNPRHILLAYDFICSRGYPYGANFTGAGKMRIGTFALATLEQAPVVVIRDAGLGRKGALDTATAIGLGAKIPFGTGTVTYRVDQKLRDEYENEMRKRREEKSLTITSDDLDVIGVMSRDKITATDPGEDSKLKGIIDTSLSLAGEVQEDDELLVNAINSSSEFKESQRIVSENKNAPTSVLGSTISRSITDDKSDVKVDLIQPPKPVVSSTPAVAAISQASIISIEPVQPSIDLGASLTSYTPDITGDISEDLESLNKL